MKYALPFFTALVTLTATLAHAADIEIKQQWTGTNRNDALKAEAPASHAIMEKAAWETLWKSWRGEEAIPAVDFDKELILVAVVSGPNQARVGKLTSDDKGDVKILAMSTRMGGPGFGYALLRVGRKGIKSVDGQPLIAPPATATKPSTVPATAAKQSQP